MFERLYDLWQQHHLSSWLDQPQLCHSGYLHRIYRLATAEGVVALKRWSLSTSRASDGLTTAHLSQLCQNLSVLCVADRPWIQEYFIGSVQPHEAWTYSMWNSGVQLRANQLSDQHWQQLFAAVQTLHHHAVPPSATTPSPWFDSSAENFMADEGADQHSQELAELVSRWYALQHQLGEDDVVFCHRDWQFEHLFWQGPKLVGLLDWECAGVVDRTYAVLNMALSLSCSTGEFDWRSWQYFLQYYPTKQLDANKMADAITWVCVDWLQWAWVVHLRAAVHSPLWLKTKNITSWLASHQQQLLDGIDASGH